MILPKHFVGTSFLTVLLRRVIIFLISCTLKHSGTFQEWLLKRMSNCLVILLTSRSTFILSAQKLIKNKERKKLVLGKKILLPIAITWLEIRSFWLPCYVVQFRMTKHFTIGRSRTQNCDKKMNLVEHYISVNTAI